MVAQVCDPFTTCPTIFFDSGKPHPLLWGPHNKDFRQVQKFTSPKWKRVGGPGWDGCSSRSPLFTQPYKSFFLSLANPDPLLWGPP